MNKNWSTFSLVNWYYIFIDILGFKRYLFTMIRKTFDGRIQILTDWRSAKNKTVYGNNTLQTTKIGWKIVGRRILIILNERKILDCLLCLAANNTHKWEVLGRERGQKQTRVWNSITFLCKKYVFALVNFSIYENHIKMRWLNVSEKISRIFSRD